MKLVGNRCQCTACGEYFNSARTFDRHRVGRFAPLQRRCLTVTEMEAKGWVRNAAGYWISGKRRILACASRVGAAIALAGYWIASDVLAATERAADLLRFDGSEVER
jgi:hypothetical protein